MTRIYLLLARLLLVGCGSEQGDVRDQPASFGVDIRIRCIDGKEFVIAKKGYGLGIAQILPPQECKP